MLIATGENAAISVGEAKNELSSRSVEAAHRLSEVICINWMDHEGEPIPERVTLFNDRFLELVFLGDARAELTRDRSGEAKSDWPTEVARAIRKAATDNERAKGMEKGRLFTNPTLRSDSYQDMMTQVAFATGDELLPSDRRGKEYAARVALNQIIFVPRTQG